MFDIRTPNLSRPSTTSSRPDRPARIPASLHQHLQDRWITVAKFPEANPEQMISNNPFCRLPKSWIRLHGLWLRQAGFLPNDRIRVRVMPGCLVITHE
ncbi:SymE family type I addiction module toxin [Collimonas silvisoli]|uniref:SymE family type I addiction module toxin n=1 Tax=Collimonas silvisoli TaxID=2825884 RepID=UPI001B8C9119|nr:SymE family type I addiction module toxin [Collimonas silvisoli]